MRLTIHHLCIYAILAASGLTAAGWVWGLSTLDAQVAEATAIAVGLGAVPEPGTLRGMITFMHIAGGFWLWAQIVVPVGIIALVFRPTEADLDRAAASAPRRYRPTAAARP